VNLKVTHCTKVNLPNGTLVFTPVAQVTGSQWEWHSRSRSKSVYVTPAPEKGHSRKGREYCRVLMLKEPAPQIGDKGIMVNLPDGTLVFTPLAQVMDRQWRSRSRSRVKLEGDLG